jgi:DNA-directed RNA polymerase specialized sigma24 family protein
MKSANTGGRGRVQFPEEAQMEEAARAIEELEKTMKALLLAEIGKMKQREQIELLSRAGFGQSEIAGIIGSTAKAVSVRLAEMRRKTRKPSSLESRTGNAPKN